MSAPAPARPRLVALDWLRGLAVAGMLLADNAGDWANVYAPLKHADWNGWTAIDMVFPTFLFSVGVALALSFPRASDPAAARAFWTRLLRRTALLILLGLALEATYNLEIALGAHFPGSASLARLRLPGILQRIGLCYLIGGALIYLTARRERDGRVHLRPPLIAGAIVALLALYWALVAFVPVPGFGAGQFDPVGALPAYIDRQVFTVPHLWIYGAAPGADPTYDPEGLLSTLPAVTNLLWGVLATLVWRRSPAQASVVIAVAGLALFVAGTVLHPVMPINKRLWTPSFALLSSGVSAVLFALLLALERGGRAGTALMPLRVLGGNAILAFILETVVGRFGSYPFIPGPTGPQNLFIWADHGVLALVGDLKLASLVIAVASVVLVTAILWPLHRRAVHFRI